MRLRQLAGFVLLVNGVCATTGCRHAAADRFDRLLVGEVLLNSQLAENLRALCLPGGRLSGSPNGHAAECFVADRARAYGLRNVHCEPFDMPGWQVNHTAVTAQLEPPLTLDGPVALWNTLSTPPEGITAALIDAGDGQEEDLARLTDELRGRFVLVRDGQGKRADKMERAIRHGAAGLIFVERPNRAPTIGTCHREPRPEPGVVVTNENGQKLAEMLAAGSEVRLNVQVQADIWDARPNNVVAEIPGSGSRAREVVMLCAHLDSWHLAEGAVDNANGAAAILETARALVASGWKPRRTVRFVWFMGEEQGLFGSRSYVATHARELASIRAMVNVDMPGAPRRFAASGPPELVELLRALSTDLRGYELPREIGTLGGDFSDHGPFVAAGVPAVAVWGSLGDGVVHYHTVADRHDLVNRPATIGSAAVLSVLVRRLADSEPWQQRADASTSRPAASRPARADPAGGGRR